jgi:hypothetical protein
MEDRRLFVGAGEAEHVVGVVRERKGLGHQGVRPLGLPEAPRRQRPPGEAANAGVVAVSGLELQVKARVVEIPAGLGMVHRPIEPALVEQGTREQLMRAHVVSGAADVLEFEHLPQDLGGALVFAAALVEAAEPVQDRRQRPSRVGGAAGKFVCALVGGLDLG